MPTVSVIEQLRNFLSPQCRLAKNLMLADDQLEAYVRKGHHVLEKPVTPAAAVLVSTLDIARIAAYQPGYAVLEFLAVAIRCNPFEAVYIELVHNRQMASLLAARGWRRVYSHGAEFAPSFYRLNPEFKP